MTSQDPGPEGPGQIKKRSYKRQASSNKLDTVGFSGKRIIERNKYGSKTITEYYYK